MRVSIYKDFIGLIAGIFLVFAINLAFEKLSGLIFRSVSIGYDRLVINFTHHELQSIFASTTFLLGGLLAGFISKRRGFLLGSLVAIAFNLIQYIRVGLRYHPVFIEPQWINTELIILIGWCIPTGVAGIAGVALMSNYLSRSEHAKRCQGHFLP